MTDATTGADGIAHGTPREPRLDAAGSNAPTTAPS